MGALPVVGALEPPVKLPAALGDSPTPPGILARLFGTPLVGPAVIHSIVNRHSGSSKRSSGVTGVISTVYAGLSKVLAEQKNFKAGQQLQLLRCTAGRTRLGVCASKPPSAAQRLTWNVQL
jgi:hypothetical protein